MGIIENLLGKKAESRKKPVLYTCRVVPSNQERVEAAMREMMGRFPRNLLDPIDIKAGDTHNVIFFIITYTEPRDAEKILNDIDDVFRRRGLL